MMLPMSEEVPGVPSAGAAFEARRDLYLLTPPSEHLDELPQVSVHIILCPIPCVVFRTEPSPES